MSGEERDEPLDGRGSGPADGRESDGSRARQVPSQGGRPGFGGGRTGEQGGVPGPGAAGGPNVLDARTGTEGRTGPGRQSGPVDRGFAVSAVPAPPAGQEAAAEADTSVPQQRERRTGASFVPPAGDLPPADLPPADADLVQRMRDGDDSAYEELFRRHSGAVRRYARTCCRDAHTADDLTAEVFARTLQAVRGGAGPRQAVRAYLLTTVRRVAASWTKTARREQLVDDFAVFAAQAGRSSALPDDNTLDLGADVLAMHEAERSLAMQAFRSLPERWQAVLWHTTVEEESPSQVAPLFGLTPNATAVLAGRAREGLKQAYLQAHVSTALTEGGDCARYADRLGAYARGGLRMRAERGLRKHLRECSRCRLAAGELACVNAEIPALLPVAVVGWIATGYSLKAAGIVAGGAAGAAGAGAAAGAGGASGGAGGGTAGSAAVSEGLGAPAKAAIGGLAAVAAAAGIVWALTSGGPAPAPPAKPPVAQRVAPPAPAPTTEPPEPGAPKPSQDPPRNPSPKPSPKPSVPHPKRSAPAAAPSPVRAAAPRHRPATAPAPAPPEAVADEKLEPPAPQAPEPAPGDPPPPVVPAVYQVNRLAYGVLGDGSRPEVRLGPSGWLWQRSGMSVGGVRYGHGVTMHSGSSVTIDLNRGCTSYTARVGVDDLTLGLGAVRFAVYGDGGRLWSSPVVHGDDAALPVRVGIAGQRTIRLVVERHTPFETVALADWAGSTINCG